MCERAVSAGVFDLRDKIPPDLPVTQLLVLDPNLPRLARLLAPLDQAVARLPLCFIHSRPVSTACASTQGHAASGQVQAGAHGGTSAELQEGAGHAGATACPDVHKPEAFRPRSTPSWLYWLRALVAFHEGVISRSAYTGR